MAGSFETNQANFHGFDPARLFMGKPIDDWPKDVVFYPEEREKWSRVDDVLMNSYMDLQRIRAYIFPIYSKRLQEAIQAAGIHDFQFLPCRVADAEGNDFEGYAVANVLTTRDALDPGNSKIYYHDQTLPKLNVAGNISAIVQAALRLERLEGCHAFRLPEDLREMFVSEYFRKIFRKLKATGISFRDTVIV